eukprot:scaffold46595_cov19-Tisochrysis_lutea.AAC.1
MQLNDLNANMILPEANSRKISNCIRKSIQFNQDRKNGACITEENYSFIRVKLACPTSKV